jgi:hypothetical protein
METRSILRTIIAALVGIGIVVLFIVLMFKLIGGRGGDSTTKTINPAAYSHTAAEATLLIDTRTNIDQDHRQVKIIISGTQNEIQIIQGYQGNIIDSRTYATNDAAFNVFLQSLKLAKFSRGNDKSTADYRGYCPLGNRYVYSFNDGNKDLFRYWSTSCGEGTFGGNRALIRRLFMRQIPDRDFNLLTRSISVSA